MNLTTDECDAICNQVDREKKPATRYDYMRAAAAHSLAVCKRENVDAKELLREIRDGEVNAEDEADKFLRDHQLSELSKARAENVVLRAHIQDSAELCDMEKLMCTADGRVLRQYDWHLAALQQKESV